MAVAAFRAVDAAGMARVDFFLTDDGLYINEINTIPGFTPISQFPRLWEASGLGYEQLVARLVDLALERHAERPHPDRRSPAQASEQPQPMVSTEE